MVKEQKIPTKHYSFIKVHFSGYCICDTNNDFNILRFTELCET